MTRLRGGISGIGQRKPRIQRNWTLAREKVEAEGCCRNCGSPVRVEAAHVVGREHDLTPPIRMEVNGTVMLRSVWASPPKPMVHPDRIIPLCYECHQGPNGQHAKRLDLLPALREDEELQAVADAGGISQAYTLLMPSENPKRVA